MLFNSYIFILLFLPVTYGIFWGLQKTGRLQTAMSFLVLASLAFYSYWNPPFLFLIIGSIVFNYTAARLITQNEKWKKAAVWAGVAGNLGLLGYFKYAGFFAANIFTLTGYDFSPGEIFLPLGISFFTFQQITYLLDLYKKKIELASFRDYALFVSFFPQLIAGPIVHAKEMLPQFRDFEGHKKFYTNMAMGLSLFSVGLFKKVVLADQFAGYATPMFERAAESSLSFFDGWTGALAYTFQLYFDFSGYSDMALGLAALFGIYLPYNFFSPYKAASISDFWRRWHITMSRFFRDYIYIPLGGNRVRSSQQAANLMMTMFLAGLWHGAGWTFIFWGVLHGIYLIINHVFSFIRLRYLNFIKGGFIFTAFAHLLTLLAVVVGWVFFRAENFNIALNMLKAMFGFNGIVLPRQVFNSVLSSDDNEWLRLASDGDLWLNNSAWSLPWIFAGYLICILLPNSMQLYYGREGEGGYGIAQNSKRFKLYAGAAGLAFVVALFSMQRVSEFLYFQF